MIFYREVFKAKHRQTGKKVALKKVLMENEKEGVSVGGMAGLGLLSPGLQRHMAARELGCTGWLLGNNTSHVFLLLWDPSTGLHTGCVCGRAG